MTKCSFCGYEFEESSAKKGCGGCPLSSSCSKVKCPNCNYEMLKEPALITFIKKKWGGRNV